MLKAIIDIQQNSMSIIDLLSLMQDNTEVVLMNGDIALAKVTPINHFPEKITPKAGLHLGAMVMSDDFGKPLPDEFWLS